MYYYVHFEVNLSDSPKDLSIKKTYQLSIRTVTEGYGIWKHGHFRAQNSTLLTL